MHHCAEQGDPVTEIRLDAQAHQMFSVNQLSLFLEYYAIQFHLYEIVY